MEIDLIDKVISLLSNKKAKDIEAFNLSEKSDIVKYLVIATISDELTARKIAHELEKNFADFEPSIDGEFPGDWIILDLGDVVVELFLEETRAKYNLEKLWGNSHNKVEQVKKAN